MGRMSERISRARHAIYITSVEFDQDSDDNDPPDVRVYRGRARSVPFGQRRVQGIRVGTYFPRRFLSLNRRDTLPYF
jgi:hypothetical protein